MLRILTLDNRQISTIGSSISTTNRNNLLSEDGLYRPFSWPFTLPIKGNEEILKHLHSIDTRERNATLEVRVEVDGSVRIAAELSVVRADKNYYYVQIEGSMGVGDLPQTNLPDLMGNDTLTYTKGDDMAPSGMNQYHWPQVDLCWPTWQNDDEYYLGKYDYAAVNYVKDGVFYLGATTANNAALYLPAALVKICAKIGYSLSGTFFENTELCTLIVMNNYMMAMGGVTVVNIPYKNLLPNETAVDFFNKLRGFGITCTLDTVKRIAYFDAMDAAVDNAEVCDVTDYIDRDYEIEMGDYNGMCQDITLSDSYGSSAISGISDMVADHTIAFIDQARVTAYYISSDTLTLGEVLEQKSQRVYVLNGNIVYIDIGDVIYAEGENAYYRINDDEELVFVGYKALKNCEGEGELQLPQIYTTAMYMNDELQLVPRMNIPISDDVVSNPFEFRLLFFRGWQNDRSGYKYGYATCTNTRMTNVAPKNSETYGRYSLLPQDPSSVTQLLVFPFYKRLTDTKRYICMLHGDWQLAAGWNERMLMRKHSTNFIWELIESSIDANGYGVTRVRLLKIS